MIEGVGAIAFGVFQRTRAVGAIHNRYTRVGSTQVDTQYLLLTAILQNYLFYAESSQLLVADQCCHEFYY